MTPSNKTEPSITKIRRNGARKAKVAGDHSSPQELKLA